MKFTVKQIAQILEGEIQGDESIEIYNLAKIDEDAKPGSITFLSNPKYESFLYLTSAEVIVVNQGFKPKKKVRATLILVKDAYTAFSNLLDEYAKRLHPPKVGIEAPSFASKSATWGDNFYLGAFSYLGENVQIGKNVQIYPQCHIGDNVVIGDNTILYAGVKVYHNCIIGKHCTLHAGVVIGSDGFGFAPQPDGTYKNIPQIGNVILEDHVNIGANTVIDRATFGSTILQQGVKLDNLIQIGHNVAIGENTVMSAQVGVSGSTKIGKNCQIGGQTGFAGHIKIADGVRIAGQSGIISSVKQEGSTLFGSPAFHHTEFMKSFVLFKKFPEIAKRLEQLEKTLIPLKKGTD